MNDELVYRAQTRRLFHTDIKIKIPVFCDDALFDELFGILENIDTRYNSYSKGSFFDRINENAGSFVEVDHETIYILQQLRFFSDLFQGEYDITIMPLIRLWGFYKDEGRRVPLNDEIEKVRPLVDYKKIEIEGNKVKIGKEQEIITGSFMKSYAVDKVVKRLKELQITDAIINAGRSTIKAINNNVHPYWQIDVHSPFDVSANLFRLQVSNACFSTSAQTNIYVEIDGRKYGHIISPKTGYPSENRQVGIITDSCFVGDVVSTGLFNQTAEGFIDIMQKLSALFPISGFLIDKDGEQTFSGDFQKHIM